ncbi:DedA family protein [Caulobacter segnis]|uniref:DedA family protein n=1 Tax=Caulobacter segnis TaxID=88688 RepID=UPI00285CCD34|nr:DedA family protein [Caulobacter segnis]MDR6625356.1 membrane protein DedA with SNARE-associated domain [Caulobacter segnis]
MDTWIADLSRVAADNAGFAGAILFAFTLLEALLVVGLLIPILGVMLAAGALVAQGVLHPVEAILWCSAGAAVGDAISYMMGRGLGGRRASRFLFAGKRRLLARAKLLTRRHGVLAIAAARYLGPARPFIPILAGMSRTRGWSFQIANVLSAPVWVVSLLAPGYLAARNLELLRTDPAVAIALLVAAAAVIGGGWVMARRMNRVQPA